MMIKKYIPMLILLVMVSCKQRSKLPAIAPDVITEKTPNDTDDPAIWIHPDDASKSIVFGTDKDTNGGVYAFDLDGKIIQEKSIKNIQRPNNVDLEYGFQLNDSITVDVIAFTEREKQQIRLFSVPDMKPLDGGGFPVFEDETDVEQRLAMGISLYKSPKDSSVYAIVGRKMGPSGTYLYQYKFESDCTGVSANLVRKFGSFTGGKEIEAIAVDNEMGYVYYSDEGECIKKYYAEPSMGNKELACFGGELFLDDIEGIAIARYSNDEGYIIVSDQQRGQFNIFSRKNNNFIKAVNLSTLETDGCEVVTVPLSDTFPNGLFVAMNDEKNFYFYDLKKALELE
ncbi:phytase [Allomuricauda sp. F6463D]|uniref:phytase n=1 Tax=Allomuricauda sp. F6463D TaxID=2926409 RepID=UPI001FF27596|nr:phytase [Muricauda sp. F6463D]MCK0161454.1 phytase [Muricauda sp. F6463D]